MSDQKPKYSAMTVAGDEELNELEAEFSSPIKAPLPQQRQNPGSSHSEATVAADVSLEDLGISPSPAPMKAPLPGNAGNGSASHSNATVAADVSLEDLGITPSSAPQKAPLPGVGFSSPSHSSATVAGDISLNDLAENLAQNPVDSNAPQKAPLPGNAGNGSGSHSEATVAADVSLEDLGITPSSAPQKAPLPGNTGNASASHSNATVAADVSLEDLNISPSPVAMDPETQRQLEEEMAEPSHIKPTLAAEDGDLSALDTTKDVQAVPVGDRNTSPASPSALGQTPTETEFVGEVLCNYKIVRKIAEGGMGVVYWGEHTMIGRTGAIKILKPEYCQDEQVVQRFYQEARSVNTIQHENIVDIYDFGRTADGRVFFVMELLDGEPLADRVLKGPIPFAESLSILEQTLRALKAAHDKDFVHRDLKPDNIFLSKRDGPPLVKLLDFGIAKLVGLDGAQEKLTRTGAIIGTPHYMAPEQIEGKNIDHRTDIYAMGIIIYELWTGQTPFGGETLGQIIKSHLLTPAPRLKDLPESLGVPKGAADIIDRALRKDPSERYDSVSEMLSDLKAVAKNRPLSKKTLSLAKNSPSQNQAGPQGHGGLSPATQLTTSRKNQQTSYLVPALIGAVALGFLGVLLFSYFNKPPAPIPIQTAGVVSPEPVAKEAPEPLIDYDKVREDSQTLLHNSLKEAEPEIRVEGSVGLGEIKDETSVPKLVELIEADPDDEVRVHAVSALGKIGDKSVIPNIQFVKNQVGEELGVWFSEALARLGEKDAYRMLEKAAKQEDLALAFKAALALSDIAQTGDKNVIRILTNLVKREAELNEIAPYSGAILLTKLARLGDPKAKELLIGILDISDEGVQLAAAEGLARLGDESGRQVLENILANENSPNRLVAAKVLVLLGDYSGYDLLTKKLEAKEKEVRRLAARGLGEIGEKESVRALAKGLHDPEWTVRIASSVALLTITGFDPKLLAQASVDWAQSALASEDWAVRNAAAGVIGDIPEKQALPLLAQAIVDPDPKVRLTAVKSAGKLKGDEAVGQLASALSIEDDKAIKEEVVKSLGTIGNPVAKDTLSEVATTDTGRLGILASGSLIAVGDVSGKDRLDEAIEASQVSMRIAAAEAAGYAQNPVVVPTLVNGVDDRVFTVRFLAAEGLATYQAEKEKALPALEEGLKSRDKAIQARATASLARFGESISTSPLSPEELLESNDPNIRLLVIPIIKESPPDEAISLLRRVLVDPNETVRRQGIDVLGEFATSKREEVIKLDKKLTKDTDPVCRAKAKAQLSQLIPPLEEKKTPATKAVSPVPAPEPETLSTKELDAIKELASTTTSALEEVKTQASDIESYRKTIESALRVSNPDDAALKDVEKKAQEIQVFLEKLQTASEEVESFANDTKVASEATPSEEATRLVLETEKEAKEAKTLFEDTEKQIKRLMRDIKQYTRTQTGDPATFIASATAALTVGKFSAARKSIQKAEELLKDSSQSTAPAKFAYAELYDKQGSLEKNLKKKQRFLQQAKRNYELYIPKGAGKQLSKAKIRSEEIGEELEDIKKELEATP